MNLLVLAPQPFFQKRGTPIATLKLLHVLSDNGYHIDLLTFHEGSDINVENCNHYRIPAVPFLANVPPGLSIKKLFCDVLMALITIKLCLRNNYQLIHAVEESVFIALIAKWLFGIPYVYDMDSSLPQQIEDQIPMAKFLARPMRFCERLAVRQSKGVVAVCESLEDVANSYCDSIPVVRIEDASLVTQAPQPRLSTSDDAISDSPPTLPLEGVDGRTLMYVGNLQRYQGIDLLIHAFVHLYHTHSDLHLVIVGGSIDAINKYRNMTRRFSIADRVHFLGPRPIEELGSLLTYADVLVSPRCKGTNTPMKVFSYLESGTPVVATRLPTHT